jgi:hypothetical protein
MPRKLYSVQFTEYGDDYKHRYDNGVYPCKLHIFSCKTKANKFINSELCERIFDLINQCDLAIENEYLDYVTEVDEQTVIKPEYENNREILEKFYINIVKVLSFLTFLTGNIMSLMLNKRM